jgi:hypothetical protein
MPLYRDGLWLAVIVGALGRRAAAERLRQRARGGAHVVHGHDRPGAGHPRERRADRLRHALIELVGHDPPDVVRLDDARKITQCGPALRDSISAVLAWTALPSLSVLGRP